MLSLSSSDELGAQLILRHSDDQHTCVAVDRQMVDGEHLMMDDIFHYYDGYFLMSTSHLNENFFPTSYLDHYGVNLVIDEWSSFGDLQEIAFQRPMKCKDRNLIWEDGILY